METELGKTLSSTLDLPPPKCMTLSQMVVYGFGFYIDNLIFLIFIRSSYWIFKRHANATAAVGINVLSSARFQQSTTPP